MAVKNFSLELYIQVIVFIPHRVQGGFGGFLFVCLKHVRLSLSLLLMLYVLFQWQELAFRQDIYSEPLWFHESLLFKDFSSKVLDFYSFFSFPGSGAPAAKPTFK